MSDALRTLERMFEPTATLGHPRLLTDATPTPAVLVARTAVQAGFPSPAQDYYDGRIDLNSHLIRDATSTYVVRVAGDSMRDAGISDGDEVIVDRSIAPADGHVVVAVLDGELTLKRLRWTPGGVVLQAENPAFPDITVPELGDLTIWGVVTKCLHNV